MNTKSIEPMTAANTIEEENLKEWEGGGGKITAHNIFQLFTFSITFLAIHNN